MENFKAGDDYSSDMGSEGSKDLFTILVLNLTFNVNKNILIN